MCRRILRRSEMTETDKHKMKGDQTRTDNIYLPAVALPPTYDRIEAVISDLFDFRQIDPIAGIHRK